MYIEIYPDCNSVRISKKLMKAMAQADSTFRKANPKFVQIVRITGTNNFCIVPRKPSDTFKMQCSICQPTGKRKTPYSFNLNIPSLEFISLVTGMTLQERKVLKVAELQIPSGNLTVFKICNR